jgi:hypothetical protein
MQQGMKKLKEFEPTFFDPDFAIYHPKNNEIMHQD